MSMEQTNPDLPLKKGRRYTQVVLDQDGSPGVVVELPDGTQMVLSMPHAKRVFGAELDSMDQP